MAWFNFFKLGEKGLEVDLLLNVASIKPDIMHVEQIESNILGDKRRSILKMNVPVIQVDCQLVSDNVLAILRGLHQSLRVLNFLAQDSIPVKNQIINAASASSVVLPNTSATGITIDGVFLSTDIARTGTNYFSGGSFDEPSFTISLGSSLPSDNQEVIVDYHYTGHRVMITKLSPEPYKGKSHNLWKVAMQLEGA